jgi:hypothetical protein
MTSSRVIAGGPENTSRSTSGEGSPTDRSPVVDIMGVRERIRWGCSMAMVCAMAPPIDAPTTCAF